MRCLWDPLLGAHTRNVPLKDMSLQKDVDVMHRNPDKQPVTLQQHVNNKHEQSGTYNS
jgi:hypothetical protein